jgi:hypothetical protein
VSAFPVAIDIATADGIGITITIIAAAGRRRRINRDTFLGVFDIPLCV